MTEQVPQILHLNLPIAPSLNNAYTNGSHGRRVLTTEGRNYKRKAMTLAQDEADRIGMQYRRGMRVTIEVIIHFGTRCSYSRRDIDNCYKLMGDAVAEALGYNDNVVDRIVLERGELDLEDPRCEVVVTLRVV